MQVPAAEEGNEKSEPDQLFITADVDPLESCDIREKVGEKEDSVEWDSSYVTDSPLKVANCIAKLLRMRRWSFSYQLY